jgi:Spy/CpxP family protein refolding chaperone
MMKRVLLSFAILALWGTMLSARQLRGGPGGGPPPPPPGAPGRGHGGGMPPGKWWDKSDMIKKLKLKTDQRKKMDEVFQELRGKLMELNISVDKEEAALEPQMEAGQLDDSKILPQIDRIAQTRAELEKVEARLVLGLRHVLTAEQWKMLQSDHEPPDFRR